MELYAVTIVAFAGLFIVLTKAENMYYRPCPSHYYYDKETEKCYGHYPDTALTWDKAREHCQSEGGDLIVSNEKNTSGYGYLQHLNSNVFTPRLWLGLRDIATTGNTSEFRWIDDNPLEYKVWARGHPSDRNPDTSVCVERVYDVHSRWYLWKDVHCSEKIPFVCERQSNFFRSCPLLFKSHSERKKCISLIQMTSTWDAARVYCQDLGGDLVVIPDKTYNEFIKQMLWNNRGYWIGLRDTTTNYGAYELKWVDGSSLDFYTDWHVEQPDYERNGNSPIDAGDICGAFINFRWENRSCDARAAYSVCEKDFNEPLLCPGDDWMMNTRNRMCYKIPSKETITFDASRALCQQDGGDLANIADAETKRILLDRIQPTIDEYYNFWLGLKMTNYENRTFGWLDGSSFDELESASFSSGDDDECGVFDFRHDRMRYVDTSCTRKFNSICQKNALGNYPMVECPQGYIFTQTKDSRVKCVIGQTKPKSWLAAVDDCTKMGSELFSIEDPVQTADQMLKTQLLSSSINKVWSTNLSCEIYNYVNNTFESMSCDEECPYICQTWGNMTTTVVNMRNVVSLGLISFTDSVLPVGGNNDSALLVSDVCKASSLTELYTMYNWTINSLSTVSIFTGANFVQLVLETKIATCQVYEKEPCCVLVNLKSSNLQTKISFPMEQILCACLPGELLLYSETQSTTIGIESTQNTTIGFEDTQSTTIDNEATQSSTIDNEATQSTATENEATQSTTIDNESTQSSTIDNEATQSTTIDNEATQSTTIDNDATQSTTIDNEATQSTTIGNEAIQSTTIAIEATQSTTIDNEATQNITMVIETTREAVSYLRNLTTPKNNSAAPNNLCPCRCDIVGIDFNPSPQILAEIIFKIQKELKVDTEQLSQKRNKKISAPDRRTGSQAMGYVGIVMVLIPVCLLVALDLTRPFPTNTDT